MKRRQFITLLGGAAVAWPLPAHAQQGERVRRIGMLTVGAGGAGQAYMAAFHDGLAKLGWVEGRNLRIDLRFGGGDADRIRAYAAELVSLAPDVIVTSTVAATRAVQQQTQTIPIVIAGAGDPVANGIVKSLARPEGNTTGVTNLYLSIGGKWLELLKEAAPRVDRVALIYNAQVSLGLGGSIIALLVNPTNAAQAETLSRDLQAVARALGLQLHILHASTERDFDTVFATLVQLRAGGLVIGPDGLFTGRSEQLGALTASHAMPAISPYREFATAGGLLSYAGSLADTFRMAGVYTGRILKGEKPADLPVQQSTKVELIVNLKAAKALGLTVPQLLLGRADEIIE